MGSRVIALGLFAAAAFSIGCASKNAALGVYECPGFVELPPMLAQPNSGATGVPDNIGTLVITNLGDPGVYTLESSGSGDPVPIGSPGPVPSAQAAELPTYNPLTAYAAIAVPTLSPATQYSLTYRDTQTGPCEPAVHGTATVGFFTTQ